MADPVEQHRLNGIGSRQSRVTTARGCYNLFMSDEASTLIVYTDGACRGNPGRGGWAWAVPGGRFASGAEPNTTNQRMEITAVLEALRALTPDRPAEIQVVSDSTYVVNCFRDRWWEGWLKRDWKNSQRKPVANRDLWEPLLAVALSAGRPGDVPLGQGALGGSLERRGGRARDRGRRPGARVERRPLERVAPPY